MAEKLRYTEVLLADYEEETLEYREEKLDDRDNSGYDAANRHIVKFTDELKAVDERAATDFEQGKNPAEYNARERDEVLEAYVEAFNQTDWNSDKEKNEAANDIAQAVFQPLYPRIQLAEAAAQHQFPEEFLDKLREENIEYLEIRIDDQGQERFEFRAKDIETAERLVAASGNSFQISQTKQLDNDRDRFADALYHSEERPAESLEQMKTALEGGIRHYEGNPDSNRPESDQQQMQVNGQDEEQNAGSDRRQAMGAIEYTAEEEGQAEQNRLVFQNLQGADEFTLNEQINELVDQKLAYTAGYLGELTQANHPNAISVEIVQNELHDIIHKNLTETVETGNEEKFLKMMDRIEDADREFAEEMRINRGFVTGDAGDLKRIEWTNGKSLSEAREYLELVNETVEHAEDNTNMLNYPIMVRLRDKVEEKFRDVEERIMAGEIFNHREAFSELNDIGRALNYITRPESDEFWQLRDMTDSDERQEIIAARYGELREANPMEFNLGDGRDDERRIILEAMCNQQMEYLDAPFQHLRFDSPIVHPYADNPDEFEKAIWHDSKRTLENDYRMIGRNSMTNFYSFTDLEAPAGYGPATGATPEELKQQQTAYLEQADRFYHEYLEAAGQGIGSVDGKIMSIALCREYERQIEITRSTGDHSGMERVAEVMIHTQEPTDELLTEIREQHWKVDTGDAGQDALLAKFAEHSFMERASFGRISDNIHNTVEQLNTWKQVLSDPHGAGTQEQDRRELIAAAGEHREGLESRLDAENLNKEELAGLVREIEQTWEMMARLQMNAVTV